MDFWQGHRVRLRAIEPEDSAFFTELNLDSEVSRNEDWLYPPSSSAQLAAFTDEQSKRKLENDELLLIIVDKNDTPVGTISTHSARLRNGTFSYGISILERFRRQGYATEAIGLTFRYYFDELRYQKVTTTVYAFNDGSIALHEALGFIREGTLRRMIYTDGEYHDVHWYGMTREEWRASVVLNPPAPFK